MMNRPRKLCSLVFGVTAFGVLCGLPGCVDSGDYQGGGRTIVLPGWDATGGGASSTTIEIDAGSPTPPPTDASSD
ncbi:MAG TPA: hypothetical protein VGL13_12625 [Polyangiaceae bacterium]|jgi:hypothetical protein